MLVRRERENSEGQATGLDGAMVQAGGWGERTEGHPCHPSHRKTSTAQHKRRYWETAQTQTTVLGDGANTNDGTETALGEQTTALPR